MDEGWVTHILTPLQKKTSTTLLTKARGQNNVFFFSVCFHFLSSCCQFNPIFDTLNVATIILSLKWHRQAYINVVHCVLIKYSRRPKRKPLTLCGLESLIAAWIKENQYSAFSCAGPSVKWSGVPLKLFIPRRHGEHVEGNTPLAQDLDG